MFKKKVYLLLAFIIILSSVSSWSILAKEGEESEQGQIVDVETEQYNIKYRSDLDTLK